MMKQSKGFTTYKFALMIPYFICWKLGILSQVYDQFIVLCENASDLADILSVTLEYLNTYMKN